MPRDYFQKLLRIRSLVLTPYFMGYPSLVQDNESAVLLKACTTECEIRKPTILSSSDGYVKSI